MDSKKKVKAFTLVELMIVVVIIGLLASVAIPAFQKYILKSKSSEAYILLKQVFDAQVAFDGNVTFRDATHGDVQCKLATRFMPLCLQQADPNNANWVSSAPPNGKKKHRRYSWYNPTNYNVTDQTCDYNSASWGDPRILNLADNQEGLAFGTFTSEIIGDPGYYIMRATTNAAVATEYSVDVTKTMTIFVLADLDGDYITSNLTHCWQGLNALTDPKVSAIGRSLYEDAQGDVQGTAGFFMVNELE